MYFSYSNQNKVYTPKYKCTPNDKISLSQLVQIIKSDPPKELHLYRDTLFNGLRNGMDWKQIKETTKAEKYKKELPYILLSGHCETHHNNESLDFNGCIQIDIDFKRLYGDRIAKQLKALASTLSHTVFAAISPSGYGVKILVCSDLKDKSKFKQLEQQVKKYYAEKLQISVKDIDNLTLSHPCYVPFDETVYFNPNYSVFKFKKPKKKRRRIIKTYNSFDDSLPLKAAQYLIDNHIDVTDGMNEWIRVIGACIHAFDETTAYNIANSLSSISAKHKQDEFDRTFERHLHRHVSNGATGGTLVYLAKQHGFTPSYNNDKNSNEKRTIITGKEGDKLSDLIKDIDTNNTRLFSPTGSGKNYYVANLDGFKIIAVPTIALTENIESDYKNKGAFIARTPQSFRILEKIKDIKELPKLITTTYASFRKATAYLSSFLPQVRCFIDEAHNMTSSTSSGFQLKQLTDVLNESKRYKSVTLLTGTELYNTEPFINSLPIIDVRIPKDRINFDFVDCKNIVVTTVEAIERSIKKNRFPIVLFNNKSETGHLKTLKTMLEGEPIKFFNANNKLDKDWIKLIQKGYINENIRGFVTTTVLKEGNNINNHLDFDIIIVGMFHASTIEQLRARARNPRSVRITILRGMERKTSDEIFKVQKAAYYLKRQAQSICDELNIKTECTTIQMINENRARKTMQENCIKYNDIKDTYQIDYLNLNNKIHFYETVATYRNDELFKKKLAQYGIHHQGDHRSQIVLDDNSKKVVKQQRQVVKAEQKKEYIHAIDKLKTLKEPYIFVHTEIETNEKGLSIATKKAYKWFKYLYEKKVHTVTDIYELLKSFDLIESRYKNCKRQINILRMENDLKYMNKNRKFGIVLKAIRSKLKANEAYTSDELKAIVINSLKLDKGFNLRVFENDTQNKKVMSIIKLFYDTKRISKKIDGERIIKYQMLHTCLDKLYRKYSPFTCATLKNDQKNTNVKIDYQFKQIVNDTLETA